MSLPFGLAPFGIWPVTLASIVALLYCLKRLGLLHSLGVLLVFSLGKFAVGTSWIYEALITLGDISPLMSIVLVCAFVAFYALFFTLTVFLVRIAIDRFLVPLLKPHDEIVDSLGWCVGWLVFEQINYLTGVDTSFPWLHIGYAFTDTWLAGLASIGGVTLVSAVVLAIALGILLLPRMRLVSLVVIGAPWLGGLLSLQTDWTKPSSEIDVALVQANITLPEKMAEDGFSRSWLAHAELTAQVAEADLVIWPEGALPRYEDEVRLYFRRLAVQYDTRLLAGAYVRRNGSFEEETVRVYNGLVGFEPHDREVHTFLKTKLVPFGEYTPFSWLFEPIREMLDIEYSDLTRGSILQPPLEFASWTIGVSICYEIAFPYLIANRAKATDFIVAASEDGWFGNSLGPAQHMQIARMRAIETGRYIVRSTSNGITGIVNPQGKLVYTLPSNEAGVLRAKVTTMEGSTPFMYIAGFIGGLVGPFLTIGMAGLVSLLSRKRDEDSNSVSS